MGYEASRSSGLGLAVRPQEQRHLKPGSADPRVFQRELDMEARQHGWPGSAVRRLAELEAARPTGRRQVACPTSTLHRAGRVPASAAKPRRTDSDAAFRCRAKLAPRIS